ncbi:MAG: ACP S-malonyltransferase [Desulfurispora sp.]|uniref:ACP S-malonyltransferase n=1 Tax=Desulfurispora sp. TaxID=3014275 RepID=UPI00404AE6B2
MSRIAFLFPGQGAQYVGMGRDIYEHSAAAREVFDRAAAVLPFDLRELCFNGPEEKLKQTMYAQPAILTVSIALWRALQEAGWRKSPAALAGHSLGEYSALVVAGSLEPADAAAVVHQRGRLMQEAVPLGQGGMVAVLGLDAARVREICAAASAAGTVEAVNLNCPGQVVIAGTNAGLERAMVLAREAGARRCMPLAVSAPFHSSLMRPAGEKLAGVLAGVRVKQPAIPVVSNVTARYYPQEADPRDLLVRQVYSPVRWEESIAYLREQGVRIFVEIGPGRVLCGLVKKICPEAVAYNVEDRAGMEKILALEGEV